MKQLTIRMSDELFAKIHERAAEAGMSVEDYAHKCLANEAFPLMVVPPDAEDIALSGRQAAIYCLRCDRWQNPQATRCPVVSRPCWILEQGWGTSDVSEKV